MSPALLASAHFSYLELTKDDFNALVPPNWGNDAIVNAVLRAIIIDKDAVGKWTYVDSTIPSVIMNRRGLRKADIEDKCRYARERLGGGWTKCLIPINDSLHWTIAIYDRKDSLANHTITFYDSCTSSTRRQTLDCLLLIFLLPDNGGSERFRALLNKIVAGLIKKDLKSGELPKIQDIAIPKRQAQPTDNHTECAYFMLSYAISNVLSEGDMSSVNVRQFFHFVSLTASLYSSQYSLA